MNNEYTIDFEPKFLDKPVNQNNFESLLQKAIYLTFLRLDKQKKINLDIKTIPLTNKCNIVRDYLSDLLHKFSYDEPLDILNLETQDILGDDVLGHSFMVIIVNNEDMFLVDPTYSQFFLKRNCLTSNYFINSERKMVLLSPHPGYFYEKNSDKKDIAKTLIENSYIRLDDDVAKIYFDSFYKLRRGYGGYMELKGHHTEIPGHTYIKSILNYNEKNKGLK